MTLEAALEIVCKERPDLIPQLENPALRQQIQEAWDDMDDDARPWARAMNLADIIESLEE